MAEPVRRCAGCGRKAVKAELFRVCRLSNGSVVFDPDKTHEGRSLYFCPDIKCFELMMRRRAPEKLMKEKLPENLRDAIESRLSHGEHTMM